MTFVPLALPAPAASPPIVEGNTGRIEVVFRHRDAGERRNRTPGGRPVVAGAVKAASPKAARRLPPDNLPRESIVHPGPCACPSCCGRLRRIGEDMTETLDYVPGGAGQGPTTSAAWWSGQRRRLKVVRHGREAFSCRACENMVQTPAPDHAIARGRAGPGLLAHIVVAKFDDHLPCTVRPRSTPGTASSCRPRPCPAWWARRRPR